MYVRLTGRFRDVPLDLHPLVGGYGGRWLEWLEAVLLLEHVFFLHLLELEFLLAVLQAGLVLLLPLRTAVLVVQVGVRQSIYDVDVLKVFLLLIRVLLVLVCVVLVPGRVFFFIVRLFLVVSLAVLVHPEVHGHHGRRIPD